MQARGGRAFSLLAVAPGVGTGGCERKEGRPKSPERPESWVPGDRPCAVASDGIGLGVQKEAGQMVTEFCQENTLVIANTLLQQHKRRLHRASPDVNTEIRLIIFFAAKNGEAIYSQQKQNQELTVAQIMISLLANSDFN